MSGQNRTQSRKADRPNRSRSVNKFKQLAHLSPWVKHSQQQTGKQHNGQRDTLCRRVHGVSQTDEIASAHGCEMLKPKLDHFSKLECTGDSGS